MVGTLTYTQVTDIIKEAEQAAKDAVEVARRQYRDTPAMKKGFAYVQIVTRPTTSFVMACKKHKIGILNERLRTLSWLNPGGFAGKNNKIYEAGGRAFLEVLDGHGIDAELFIRQDV